MKSLFFPVSVALATFAIFIGTGCDEAVETVVETRNEIKYNHAVVRVCNNIERITRLYKDKEYINALKEVDLSDCPSDFKEAYYRFVEASDEAISYRLSGSFFHPISENRLHELVEQGKKA